MLVAVDRVAGISNVGAILRYDTLAEPQSILLVGLFTNAVVVTYYPDTAVNRRPRKNSRFRFACEQQLEVRVLALRFPPGRPIKGRRLILFIRERGKGQYLKMALKEAPALCGLT